VDSGPDQGPAVEVRLARADDARALFELEHRCFSGDRLSLRQYRHHIRNDRARVLVAERAGQRLGGAIVFLRRGSSRVRLYSIMVDPQARGQGLAGVLLQAVEDAAVDLGATELRLEVRQDNAAAIRLYNRRGYRPIGQRAGYYQDGADAWRFAKALSRRPLQPGPLDAGPLDAGALDAGALQQATGRPVQVLESCDSTNRVARELAAALLREDRLSGPLPVIVAEQQREGRGRLGRSWSAEPGANLLFSALFAPDLPLDQAPRVVLCLAAALAAELGLWLKWPNDLVDEQDRKLCGILAEHEAGPNPGRVGCLVVGVGLNVNQLDFPDLPNARSLRQRHGALQDRQALLIRLLQAMDHAALDGPQALDLWRARSRTLGRQVRVAGREGLATGLREDGALLVDGQPVLAGDVELLAPPTRRATAL